MKKLTIMLLVATVAIGFYSASAYAASTLGKPPGGGNPGGGTPGGGTPPCIDCDSADVGIPFEPFDFPEDGKGPDEDCMVDCGGPGDGTPGDDTPPDDDTPDDGTPGDGNPGDGNPGNGGDLTKADAAALRACLVRLEGLPQVSASDINAFSDPSKVSLIPVCEIKSLTESEVAIVDKGNAIGLEGAIKANDLMRTKLGMTAYKARDVVGIDFDEKGNATLFVHKQRG